MEDSKEKQINFEPEHPFGSSAAEQQGRSLSHFDLRSEEKNTRQTTLEEFFYVARGGLTVVNGGQTI